MAPRSAAARLLMLAFALGALVGGGIMLLVDRTIAKDDRPPTQEGGYLGRLTSELSLTESQQVSVKEVLRRHEPAMDSVWAEVRWQFDGPRQAVARDIRTLLTPEQVTKYEAYLARRDSAQRAKGKHDPK